MARSTHPRRHPDERRAELSQHFLRDHALAERIVEQARVGPGNVVVEPGPGRGALTEALAARGCRVIAVERDVRLYRGLRERFIGRTNVEVHHADALRFPLPAGRFAVVANVPYGITAALVRRLLRAPAPPEQALLIVQREAAEKFAGAPRETLFSLLHKPRFAFETVHAFRRTVFEPPPRVESVLLRISLRRPPLLDPLEERRYAAFVRATFGARGETVARALRAHLTRTQVRRLARDLGFATDARPSELSFGQWLRLWRFYEHVCLGRDPTLRATARTIGALSGRDRAPAAGRAAPT